MAIWQLKKLQLRLPQKPGIYLFKNNQGKALYIGKALNLKNRVGQYLKVDDVRLRQMISKAEKIDFVKTDSEIEALILESQYIKKYKPAFNIMLRDDKQFFYVVFTREKFPKIFLSHQPHSTYRNSEISSFVGPFTDGTSLKTTLRYLRKVFPYCTCKQSHHNFCLNYHIGKCPGFCCFKQQKPNQQLTTYNQQQYGKNIKAIKDILSGKKTSLLKGLEKEMIKLGKKERFNEAIELRDKIEKIKRVFENARIIQNIPYYDISNNYSGGVLLELKKFLKLKQLPYRIEGYDVANIQGKYAVGAMVVFTDGKPDKNEYRKFKIYGKQSFDDTAMLKEVLTRRFNHPEWPHPDLILVDGGKQQLNATIKVLRITNYALKIPIIALAKNKKHIGEKIFISGRKNSIPLSRLPTSVKNLLLCVDSEAHRFAIGYYRKIHRRSLK